MDLCLIIRVVETLSGILLNKLIVFSKVYWHNYFTVNQLTLSVFQERWLLLFNDVVSFEWDDARTTQKLWYRRQCWLFRRVSLVCHSNAPGTHPSLVPVSLFGQFPVFAVAQVAHTPGTPISCRNQRVITNMYAYIHIWHTYKIVRWHRQVNKWWRQVAKCSTYRNYFICQRDASLRHRLFQNMKPLDPSNGSLDVDSKILNWFCFQYIVFRDLHWW